MAKAEAYIFDIQRCSFVDGPGIRTTVFFKGCNLRCKWCHNPESWLRQPQVLYFAKHCLKCDACIKTCPVQAMQASYHPDPAVCIACGKCVSVCPVEARQLCGRLEKPEDIFELIKKDKVFYEASGGGVTFSGGECLLQLSYLLEIIALCKQEEISVAIDTAGNVPYSHFAKIVPEIDLILFDLKAIDPQLHKRLTGTDNDLIIANFIKLQETVPEKLHVRVPVIPNYNLFEPEMAQIASFLKKYPPARLELLPYHRLGENKRTALGLEDLAIAMPSTACMQALASLFGLA